MAIDPNSIDELRNGIREHKRGQLAARHHEIANRNFLVDYLFYNALVYSLIVTAQQSDIVELRQLDHALLGQRLSLRGQIYKMRARARVAAEGLVAVIYRLHLHYHARPAAVGRIVDAVVLVERIVADVAAVYFNAAALARSAYYALPEHLTAHLREEGKNINPHLKTALSAVLTERLRSLCQRSTQHRELRG